MKLLLVTKWEQSKSTVPLSFMEQFSVSFWKFIDLLFLQLNWLLSTTQFPAIAGRCFHVEAEKTKCVHHRTKKQTDKGNYHPQNFVETKP